MNIIVACVNSIIMYIYICIYIYIYNATYCIGPVPGGEHGALRRRRGSLDRLKAPQALQQSVQALASLPAQTPLNVGLSATSSLSLHTEEGGSGEGRRIHPHNAAEGCRYPVRWAHIGVVYACTSSIS